MLRSIEAFYFYDRLNGHFIFPHDWSDQKLGKADLVLWELEGVSPQKLMLAR